MTLMGMMDMLKSVNIQFDVAGGLGLFIEEDLNKIATFIRKEFVYSFYHLDCPASTWQTTLVRPQGRKMYAQLLYRPARTVMHVVQHQNRLWTRITLMSKVFIAVNCYGR